MPAESPELYLEYFTLLAKGNPAYWKDFDIKKVKGFAPERLAAVINEQKTSSR